MRRTGLITTILLSLLSLPRARTDHEIAVVTRVRGVVMTFYGRDGLRTRTVKGQLLFNRATLNTGESGTVQLRFIKGGSTVLIPSGSEVMLTLEGAAETGRINSGKAIFDGQPQHQGSLDIVTPATITTTTSQCVSLVTHEHASGNSALFITSGTSMITDPEFSGWRPFSAPSAVYVTAGSPLVHTSALTTGDTTRLDRFLRTARSMRITEPLTHTLVIRPDTGGAIMPGDTMTALQGYAVEVVARPEPGNVFVCWEVLHGAAVIGNSFKDSTTITLSTDALVAARFTGSPAKLLVKSRGEGTTVPEGIATIPRNKPWKISAYPYFGYTLKKWVPSPGVTIIASDSVSAVIMVEQSRGGIRAEFDKRSFSCRIGVTAGGTAAPGDTVIVSGDSLRITATPDKGYSFIRWEITGGRAVIAEPYEPTTAIRCDSGDVQIRARFNRSNQTIKVVIRRHKCASISPVGTIAVPRGETFPLSAIPLPGYQLNRWVVRFGEANSINGLKTTIRPLSNCELLPEITTKTFNLTVGSRGPGTTVPAGPTRVFYNTPSTVTATAQPGKKFACWEVAGGDAAIADRFNPKTTVQLASTDAVIAAEFASEICTLIVDATIGGYIEPADTQILYLGKEVGIKAVPNPRAAFLGWSVDTGKEYIDFSDTLTVREQLVRLKKIGNVKITARFSTQTVELNVLNNGLGMTSPEKSVWVPQDQWMPLKATPAEGNKFLHWVIVAGVQCELRDQFSAETEINPGTASATVKALFDTASGYTAPDFASAGSKGPYRLTIRADRSAGEVLPAGPLTVERGMPVTLNAQSLPRFTFYEWVVVEGNAIISDRYTGTTTVMLSKSDAVIEARFLPEKTHLIRVDFFGPKNQKKTIVIPYR